MILRFSDTPLIDNLRNYPEHLVSRLAAVLCAGAVAQPDPRRKGFYDVADGDRVFFIHLSPVSGKVWLLASWVAEKIQPERPLVRVPAVIARAPSMFFAGCAHP